MIEMGVTVIMPHRGRTTVNSLSLKPPLVAMLGAKAASGKAPPAVVILHFLAVVATMEEES